MKVPDLTRAGVLADVAAERAIQERRKAEGRFEFTCADAGMTNAERLTVLCEEYGEAIDEYAALRLGSLIGHVAREVLTQNERRLARDTAGTKQALYDELIQVAAVAAAWAEAVFREMREGE